MLAAFTHEVHIVTNLPSPNNALRINCFELGMSAASQLEMQPSSLQLPY
jgi:hypothetical protein